MNIKFMSWDCVVDLKKYGNGRNAIALTDAEDGQPVTVASVNLPDEPMESDEIAIKDYSENEGMLNILIDAGIVSQPVRFVRSGFVSIPVCKLLLEEPA